MWAPPFQSAWARIVTNPEPGEPDGTEIAMSTVYDAMLTTRDVWRPGEGPFADRDWS